MVPVTFTAARRTYGVWDKTLSNAAAYFLGGRRGPFRSNGLEGTLFKESGVMRHLRGAPDLQAGARAARHFKFLNFWVSENFVCVPKLRVFGAREVGGATVRGAVNCVALRAVRCSRPAARMCVSLVGCELRARARV